MNSATSETTIAPYVGMSCNFFFDYTSDPVAAIVTKIGTEMCLSLIVFHPSFSTGDIYDGVRYIYDTKSSKSVEDGNGLWDYTLPDRRLRDQPAEGVIRKAKLRKADQDGVGLPTK